MGEDSGQLYIAMEYVSSSLQALIDDLGRLPIDESLRIVREITSALAAAHEKRIVHRDIKPGNILLTETSSVRVSDFGIATATDLASMTATGVIMGTPYYMSPEQAKGERADIRSDIYSLGIVLYHMLTGMRPFDADTSLAILRKHIDVMPPLVGHTRAGVPPELTAIVARCLEKDAALRYQTPEELAKALDQAAITIDRKRLSEAGTSAEAPEAEIEDLKNNQVNILENDDEDLSSEEAEVGIDSKEPAKAVAGMIEYEPTKEHELIFTPPVEPALILTLLHVLAEKTDCDVGRVEPSPAADTIVGVTHKLPIRLGSVLSEMPLVAKVIEEPSPVGPNVPKRLRLELKYE